MKSLTARLDKIEQRLGPEAPAEERCPVCQGELVERSTQELMAWFRPLTPHEKVAHIHECNNARHTRWCETCQSCRCVGRWTEEEVREIHDGAEELAKLPIKDFILHCRAKMGWSAEKMRRSLGLSAEDYQRALTDAASWDEYSERFRRTEYCCWPVTPGECQ